MKPNKKIGTDKSVNEFNEMIKNDDIKACEIGSKYLNKKQAPETHKQVCEKTTYICRCGYTQTMPHSHLVYGQSCECEKGQQGNVFIPKKELKDDESSCSPTKVVPKGNRSWMDVNAQDWAANFDNKFSGYRIQQPHRKEIYNTQPKEDIKQFIRELLERQELIAQSREIKYYFKGREEGIKSEKERMFDYNKFYEDNDFAEYVEKRERKRITALLPQIKDVISLEYDKDPLNYIWREGFNQCLEEVLKVVKGK